MSAEVVLIHGAWFGGWCWEPVITRLRTLGVSCTAPDLPFRSFEDDVETCRKNVAEAAARGSVVLVGHSYGGMIISAGGHEADHLVYIAALVPAPGEAGGQVRGSSGVEVELDRHLRFGQDGTVVVAEEGLSSSVFNCSPDRSAGLVKERLRPINASLLAGACDNPAWRSVPSTAVVCRHDRCLDPDIQRQRGAWLGNLIELEADHSPFLSRPAELVQLLAQLANAEPVPE